VRRGHPETGKWSIFFRTLEPEFGGTHVTFFI
jgi:hypothetical protein